MVAIGALGCSDRDVSVATIPDDPAAVSVSIAQVDHPVRVDRIVEINLPEDLRTDQTLKVSGSIRAVENDQNFIAVATVHFYTPGPSSQRIVAQSGVTSLQWVNNGLYTYEVRMPAPPNPGTYTMEVSIGHQNNVIARGTVKVQ